MKIEIITSRKSRTDFIQFIAKDSAPLPGISKAEFAGEKLTTILLREEGRTLHVGLGEIAKVSPDTLRQAAGTGVKTLLKLGAEEITIDAAPFASHVQQLVEGALLANYRFDDFKMPDAKRKNSLQVLRLLVTEAQVKAAKENARAGQILADATNHVRHIGNQPGNYLTPVTLAEEAEKLAESHQLKYEVWDEKRLKKEGFGGIIAVGQGSANPPRFIVLEYPGAPKKSAPVAIVGKAITFDSGGISIKPGDRMDEMKFDKMGGCAVLGIMQAASELKLPINLIGLIASAENMPSSRAYRPGDIVTTYGGQTIEVLNTDAEGRIVLADALAYAVKKYKPRLMFDLATLTGACVVALGGRRAGLFSLDETVRNTLWQLSSDAGDPVWPLPLAEEFDEQIKSEVALVKNTGGREGGACTAASFLKHWVGDTTWVHLDIAGPAWITKSTAYLENGATGFGVRLVTEYLRRHGQPG